MRFPENEENILYQMELFLSKTSPLRAIRQSSMLFFVARSTVYSDDAVQLLFSLVCPVFVLDTIIPRFSTLQECGTDIDAACT